QAGCAHRFSVQKRDLSAQPTNPVACGRTVADNHRVGIDPACGLASRGRRGDPTQSLRHQEKSMNDRVATRHRADSARRGWARGGGLVVLWTLAGSLAAASGQEARRADAAGNGLARYVPRQDVFILLENEGVDAFPEAWHATATYKLLSETRLGALLENFAGQGLDMAIASA